MAQIAFNGPGLPAPTLPRTLAWTAMIAVAGLLWLAAPFAAFAPSVLPGARSIATVPSATMFQALPAMAEPQAIKPLTPEEAIAANAARPIAESTDTPAAPMRIAATAESYAQAAECLTAAVYYEAAAEPLDGERAVAQVVLNRVRHPAYPASVCGVVYQGSERVTGCQFTFTCDGSLARVPSKAGWATARQVAEAALAGRVYTPVGHATHYHADYVVPYWADELDKTVSVGRHIFYRWRGGWGRARAFTQRYAGVEPDPAGFTLAAATPATEAAVDAAVETTPPPPRLAADQRPATPLLADLTAGTLIEPVRPVGTSPASDSQRLAALGPTAAACARRGDLPPGAGATAPGTPPATRC